MNMYGTEIKMVIGDEAREWAATLERVADKLAKIRPLVERPPTDSERLDKLERIMRDERPTNFVLCSRHLGAVDPNAPTSGDEVLAPSVREAIDAYADGRK